MAYENEQQAIRNLQRYLRQLSYFNSEIGSVPIDGIFEQDTRNALKAFQLSEGLPPTGQADRITWDRLFAAYTQSIEAHSEPRAISYFPQIPEDYTIEVGEVQFLVSIIQHALQELSVIYDDLENTPLSGAYDEATAAAVRSFQQANRLPATGAVDRRTWNAIADAYNRNFANPYLRQ